MEKRQAGNIYSETLKKQRLVASILALLCMLSACGFLVYSHLLSKDMLTMTENTKMASATAKFSAFLMFVAGARILLWAKKIKQDN